LLTFESNWETAKDILEKIVIDKAEHYSKEAESDIKKTTDKYLIFFNKLTPIVYTSVKDSGILLTIRYLTKARQRRNTEQDIWEAVLREFSTRHDIDFAYPTVRHYNNLHESKPAPQPPAN
jgi:small-conductance mechanosensitive channel